MADRTVPRDLYVEQLEQRVLLSATGAEGLLDVSALQVDPQAWETTHILVRYADDAGQGTAADRGERLGSTDWYRVPVPEGLAVADAVSTFRDLPGVSYAQPDYLVYIQGHETHDNRDDGVNDVLYTSGMLWGLNNDGRYEGTVDADIDAPTAWHVTTGSRGVTVAVIDTGIDYTHPDLYQNIWINQGEIPLEIRDQLIDVDLDGLITFYDLNATDGSGNRINGSFIADTGGIAGRIDGYDLLRPFTVDTDGRVTGGWANGVNDDSDRNSYVDDLLGYDFHNNDNNPMDDHSHGTHVAGTIGASANNGGSSGTDAIGVAWEVSLMGLKFLSASGSGSSSNAIRALDYAVQMGVRISNNSWGGGGYEQALADSIQRAASAGHIFVAAAGNGNRIGIGQNNDSSPHYPSNYQPSPDTVIAVAASDSSDDFASFSNYGATTVDLAAPGVRIWSTIPFSKDTQDGSQDGYARFSGTSMATPHVAGAAALIWSANPELTALEVKDLILSTTDFIGGPDTVTDGRLNAGRAVERAAALATPRLSVGDVSVVEGHEGTVQAVFTITRSGDTSQVVSVAYATQDDTATAGSDYEAVSGTLTFEAGVTSLTVEVPVYGDTDEEQNEAFFLNLSDATAGAVIVDGQGQGTILDDDGPTISIGDVPVTEGDSGTSLADFVVTLSKASLFDLTVNYATADGSATTADGDYVAASGSLTIPAGQFSGTISVVVNGDTAYEPDETFAVNLSSPSHGTLVDAQGIGTILNDDPEPVGDPSHMYVWDMIWSERLYGRWLDLSVVVDVNRDSDADGSGEGSDDPAAGASVTLLLTHDSNGDGLYDSTDTQWSGSATTGSDGTIHFTLRKALSGNYQAEVIGLTSSSLTWNSSLDGENPDQYSTGVGELSARATRPTATAAGSARSLATGVVPTSAGSSTRGESSQADPPHEDVLTDAPSAAGHTVTVEAGPEDNEPGERRDEGLPPADVEQAGELQYGPLEALEAAFASGLLSDELLAL